MPTMPSQKPATVDQYFATVAATSTAAATAATTAAIAAAAAAAAAPASASSLPQLQSMREIIKKAAPKAAEVINYSMPAVKVNGIIVWYAAFKQHIGLYPRPSAIQHFAKQLAKYATSKGAIQFSLDQPLPASLISKIVKFRLREDAAEAAEKAIRKAAKKKSQAKKAPTKKSPASKSAASKAPASKAPAAKAPAAAARKR